MPVEALYWAKSGSRHAVDVGLEASDFVEGVPRKARDVQLVAAPGGGFVGRRRPLDIYVVLNCCHSGPGEDGTLRWGVFELVRLRATGPGWWAPRLVWTSSPSPPSPSAGMPVLTRLHLTPATEPDFAPPSSSSRFGGSSIGVEVVADLDAARAARLPHLAGGR